MHKSSFEKLSHAAYGPGIFSLMYLKVRGFVFPALFGHACHFLENFLWSCVLKTHVTHKYETLVSLPVGIILQAIIISKLCFLAFTEKKIIWLLNLKFKRVIYELALEDASGLRLFHLRHPLR
ncbi:hypothetical protein POTOM_038268 [Populus tomentosa]|uniref:Uncharacterized protein n=1 Tax=Populus tomentosa TaxID=118781 RepID=A0A8X8CKY8_POPTO|nr:hypothetical protein POTOM_038268 [Populus tomentosa]